MSKYYDTLTTTSGDVLVNHRVQVLDSAGAIVQIDADSSGTRFTDSTGAIVNYATSDDLGYYEFYWTPQAGHILQILDSGGNLVRPPVTDFADNLLLDNLGGAIPQSQVTDLTADLAAKAEANTFSTLAALKAAPASTLAYSLVSTSIDGIFNYETANAPYVADDVNVIKLNSTALSVGALVRQAAKSITATDGETVQEALDAYPVAAAAASIPNPVVLKTILLDSQVSKMLSGAGDGSTVPADVTAETAKFQAMMDTGRSFSIPTPTVTYAVNQLNLVHGQTIEGGGQWGETGDAAGGEYMFTGNGVDPVFNLGDGGATINRRHTLIGVSATNTGGSCVKADTAPNLIIDNCRFLSTGTSVVTVDMRLSYRAVLEKSFISSSGSGSKAISAVNNMNGLAIRDVTCSGGSAGQAIEIGQSQGVTLENNVIESSLHGIWIASQAGSDQGNCNGIVMRGNYLEQVSTPFKIGTVFSVFGLDMSGNYVGNSETTVVSARTAVVQVGRMLSSSIHDNVFYVDDGVEDGFWIWLENALGGFNNLSFSRNEIVNTPLNIYQLQGAFAANASVKAAVGGVCNFGFIPNGIGTDHVQEWVSPLIDSSVSVIQTAWLTDTTKAFGGKIKSAEIIDYDGGVLTNVQLAIGRTASVGENFNNTNMATLSFTEGQALLTLASDNIFDGSNSTYRIITAGGATGKFRLRIRYRAN